MDPMNNMGGVPNPMSAPQSPQPQPAPQAPRGPSLPPQPSSSAGLMIAVLVILAVLVLGGFYFWSERATVPADTIPALGEGLPSDNPNDIEADLNSADINNVDYDLNPENFNAS